VKKKMKDGFGPFLWVAHSSYPLKIMISSCFLGLLTVEEKMETTEQLTHFYWHHLNSNRITFVTNCHFCLTEMLSKGRWTWAITFSVFIQLFRVAVLRVVMSSMGYSDSKMLNL
jgi:hypothetical protein